MIMIVPQPLNITASNLDSTSLANIIDGQTATEAVHTDSITLTLSIGTASYLYLYNLVADSVRMVIRDYTGTVVSDKTDSLLYAQTTDIWEYMYASNLQKTEYFTKFTVAYGATLELTINYSGQSAKVGMIVLGTAYSLGATGAEFDAGILDYSAKNADAFGNVSLVERGYVKDTNFTLYVENSAVNEVFSRLALVRAKPTLFVADNAGAIYPALVYGFPRDFRLMYSKSDYQVFNLKIEGLM